MGISLKWRVLAGGITEGMGLKIGCLKSEIQRFIITFDLKMPQIDVNDGRRVDHGRPTLLVVTPNVNTVRSTDVVRFL